MSVCDCKPRKYTETELLKGICSFCNQPITVTPQDKYSPATDEEIRLKLVSIIEYEITGRCFASDNNNYTPFGVSEVIVRNIMKQLIEYGWHRHEDIDCANCMLDHKTINKGDFTKEIIDAINLINLIGEKLVGVGDLCTKFTDIAEEIKNKRI